MRARGRIYIDARNQTAYGTLRTFVRVDTTVSTGSYGQSVNSTGPQYTVANGGAGANGTNLDRAFVQFGPLTAGRSQSFFDFYADALNYGPIRGSDNVVNMLAYTATFGGGFSATLALQDSNESRVANGNFVQGGSDYPDLVGSLNVAQGWGSAQLSGAVFQRKTALNVGVGSGDKTGFALQAGVKINLPMLAAGDELWLQAAYAEGGLSYLGYGGNSAGSTWGANTNVGRLAITNSDVNVDVLGSDQADEGLCPDRRLPALLDPHDPSGRVWFVLEARLLEQHRCSGCCQPGSGRVARRFEPDLVAGCRSRHRRRGPLRQRPRQELRPGGWPSGRRPDQVGRCLAGPSARSARLLIGLRSLVRKPRGNPGLLFYVGCFGFPVDGNPPPGLIWQGRSGRDPAREWRRAFVETISADRSTSL